MPRRSRAPRAAGSCDPCEGLTHPRGHNYPACGNRRADSSGDIDYATSTSLPAADTLSQTGSWPYRTPV